MCMHSRNPSKPVCAQNPLVATMRAHTGTRRSQSLCVGWPPPRLDKWQPGQRRRRTPRYHEGPRSHGTCQRYETKRLALQILRYPLHRPSCSQCSHVRAHVCDSGTDAVAPAESHRMPTKEGCAWPARSAVNGMLVGRWPLRSMASCLRGAIFRSEPKHPRVGLHNKTMRRHTERPRSSEIPAN